MNHNLINKIKVSVFRAKYIILYRAVGKTEYNLIKETNFNCFPKRLPEQPFFYPVCNSTYAEEIARWNAKDPSSGSCGYILKFKILEKYLRKYEKHIVGSSYHEEYWIPSKELEEFNKNIVGPIELVMIFTANQGIYTNYDNISNFR